jgi:hypothetical protein
MLLLRRHGSSAGQHEESISANGWVPIYPRRFDSFVNGVVTSIKSIDLTAATYQNVAALTYRLNQYIDRLALFEGGQMGFTVIDSSAISGRALSIAIPKGSMTAAQRAAIESSIARAQAFDIGFLITEF